MLPQQSILATWPIKAIEIFNALNIDCVFHAGDYIYPGMIALFRELKQNIKFYGVRGNNDGEIIGLVDQFSKLDNAFFLNEFGRLRIESKEVGIYLKYRYKFYRGNTSVLIF